jgi:hypothetical protein
MQPRKTLAAWTLAGLMGFGQQATPPGFFPVTPVKSVGPQLRVANGQFFSYVLPEGWQVGEDGQFALTLLAPDRRALTVMAGNAGMPIHYPPDRFVYEKLMALRPEGLRLGPPRDATPAAGFARAWQFEVAYTIQGAPCRGWAKANVAPAYDSAVYAMTAALADARQWPGYESWLPVIAEQISARNGAAFGIRGVMAQNLQNSTAYAEAARQYREWSAKTWKAVTDERQASVDRRNAEFRENLGAIETYVNPYDTGVAVELPTQYKHFWVNRQGNILATNDPGADPNVGSTAEWRRMPRAKH